MKKFHIILIIVLMVLVVIITMFYLKTRNELKSTLNSMSTTSYDLEEANGRIKVLEKELNEYKNIVKNSSVTNTLNTNTTVSSEPYIPNGVKVDENDDSSKIKASDLKFNRSPENVTIEILKDTITKENVEILITDNNEQSYGWGEDFRLQKKENNNWKEMETTNELGLAFIDIAYNLDDHNQLKLNVQYGNYYGSLENGIYRIVKPVYDNGYIDLYSDEFEIK